MARLLSLLLLLASWLVVESALAKELIVGSVGGGEIVAVVEDDWLVSSPPSPVPSAATVRLSRGDGPDVIVLVTVIQPPPGSPLSNPSAESIAGLVAGSAAQASAQSVEGELKAEAFTAGGVKGSYFSATDKAPPPGEFKYMSQGIAIFDGLAVTFTALSHANPGAARDAMLKVVGSLRVRSAE